jgi:hypothetical protein
MNKKALEDAQNEFDSLMAAGRLTKEDEELWDKTIQSMKD